MNIILRYIHAKRAGEGCGLLIDTSHRVRLLGQAARSMKHKAIHPG